MTEIVSVNLSTPKTFTYQGRTFTTGIFKKPVSDSIYLGKQGVRDDTVADKRVHGGEDKACYVYPLEHYDYWKDKFPELDWNYGMFGENLTIKGFLEKDAKVGTIYQVGQAVVQVSQPRQPCFKLGHRFNDPQMVKYFAKGQFPGLYFRVLDEGWVSTGDPVTLLEEPADSLTIVQLYALLMRQVKDPDLLEKALRIPTIAASARKDLQNLTSY